MILLLRFEFTGEPKFSTLYSWLPCWLLLHIVIGFITPNWRWLVNKCFGFFFFYKIEVNPKLKGQKKFFNAKTKKKYTVCLFTCIACIYVCMVVICYKKLLWGTSPKVTSISIQCTILLILIFKLTCSVQRTCRV